MNLSNDTYGFSGGQAKSAGDVGSWLSATVARFQNLGAWLAVKRTRARELRELYRFSDRELWDLGLSRSDIPAIEKGTYSRD
jgi:uncharacterized protein YjiS (DUF1127 family)